MPGSFCLSIDVELAWGIWDKPSPEYHQRCADLERDIVRELLAIFVRHELAATWAFVGRLLERDEAAARSTPHGDRIWYAPDLAEAVRAAPVEQDIGSHSYAHVYFGQSTREELRADLAAARRAHDQHGLAFSSFVFPRNQVAHLELLREVGIQVFRSIDHGWHIDVRERFGRTAGRLSNFADKILPVPPQPVRPVARDGLVELPSSMLLMARNGLRRAIHPRILAAKAKLGLERARRTGGAFHLWCHPSNFYYDTARQLAVLDEIVAAAAAMRDRGELELRPMSAFAA